MPTQFERVINVDSKAVAEINPWPSPALIAEINNDERRLFVEGHTNVLNNFSANLPGGRRRFEQMKPEDVEWYKREHPQFYEEYLGFYEDIDEAVEVAGLSFKAIEELFAQKGAIYDRRLPNDLTQEDIAELTKISVAMQKYTFPAYKLLVFEYGYLPRDLCS